MPLAQGDSLMCTPRLVREETNPGSMDEQAPPALSELHHEQLLLR